MSERFDDGELVERGLIDPTAEDADDRSAVLEWLVANGATKEEIASAAGAHDHHRLNALRVDLVLRKPTGMRAEDVADAAGVDLAVLVDWWRWLGFKDPLAANARFATSDVRLAQMLAAMTEFLPTMAEDGLQILATYARQLAIAFLDLGRAAMPLETTEYGWNRVRPLTDSERTTLAGIPVAIATLADAVSRHAIADEWDVGNSEGEHRTGRVMTIWRSIVFVDIVDYTRLSQRVDEPELDGILALFERDAVAKVSAVQGRLVKFSGDGVMLAFAREQDAVEVARALVQERDDLPPRRAGLASGSVVVRQGDFFGPVVNLAARLAAVAEPNTVALDHAPEGLDAERVSAVVLKGYDEPIVPYHVRP